MKNFTLSVATVLALSTFAVAGGDIAPVEPMVEAVAPAADDSGFYIGGAYSKVNTSYDWQWGYDGTTYEWGDEEMDSSAFMLQVGYQFNKYIAIEGRYWNNLTSAEGTYNELDGFTESWEDNYPSLEAYGIYVKPMYPVTNELTVYGLLGYGSVETGEDYYNGRGAPSLTLYDDSAFQWGIGASYAMTENISLFVDYVQLASDEDGGNSYVEPYGFYDDPQNYYGEEWDSIDIYTLNFGMTYKF